MKVEIKRSHFAGSVYAECDCGWKCHYWEEADELEHDCLNQSENCLGCGLDLATIGEIIDEYQLCHACYCEKMDKTKR